MSASPRGAAAEPISDGQFSHLMAPFEPFEPAPHIAVAVSGGADSMALAALLRTWTAAQGGRLVALTVDHRMRAGSGVEARQVGAWLAGLGIEQRVLAWRGPKPTANRQAAARAARYALVTAWCARRGILHLAVAHHLDDQAETLLLRLARGSGLNGLAGMASVREEGALRVLRPLLAVAKPRLRATLEAGGLPWVEDPSNVDPAFDRTRARAALAQVRGGGLSVSRLAATAGHLGLARTALEENVTGLLARCAELDPAGFAWLLPEPLVAANSEVALRALARVLMTVSGADYTPRLDRLERLHARLTEGLARGATLSGCRLVPMKGRLLVVREAGRAPRVDLGPGERVLWDGRFDLALARRSGAQGGVLRLGALGQAGWARIAKLVETENAMAVPPAARPALPALSDRTGLLEVPHMGFRRTGRRPVVTFCSFSPTNALSRARFAVA